MIDPPLILVQATAYISYHQHRRCVSFKSHDIPILSVLTINSHFLYQIYYIYEMLPTGTLLHQVLASSIALDTAYALPMTPVRIDNNLEPFKSSTLESRTVLDRRIHWEGDRLIRRNPWAVPELHLFRTQSPRCDRDRGATGWICNLYPVPTPSDPSEPCRPDEILMPVEGSDPHELGHCSTGAICVDVQEMIPPPDPTHPNLGVGPFAGGLDRSHIVQIVGLLNYKQKVRASGVGVSSNVKQLNLGGQTIDAIFTNGRDVNRETDMEYINIEVEALVGGIGARPDGYRTLDSKVCRYDPGIPNEMLRECRLNSMPDGADRINVFAKVLNGGYASGANGNVVASNLHMASSP